MNVVVEMLALSTVVVAGLVAVALMMRAQQRKIASQTAQFANALAELTVRLDKQELALRRTTREREAQVTSSLSQLQTDLKLLQLRAQDPAANRDAPESLEQAIKLAREGKPTEQIMRRTGLPQDVVEAITTLHAGRAAH
jgi:soluble lytic murein transglycosylase-like protein